MRRHRRRRLRSGARPGWQVREGLVSEKSDAIIYAISKGVLIVASATRTSATGCLCSPRVVSDAVKVGLFLSAQHPPNADPRRALAEHLEQVRFARDCGFAAIFCGQHFLTEPFQMFQPVPLLAHVAAEAGEMRVGAGILLAALLNPVEVAENVATLDAITDGRFVLGVGLGYRSEENEAFALAERRGDVYAAK